MSVRDFALPDLGEGLTESELVSWRVAVGDRVELNQIIAEVETAKALVELPSPFAGVVARLYGEEGETILVGAPIAAFEVADTEAVPGAATSPGAAAAPERNAVLVGYGPKVEGGARPARRAKSGAEPADAPAAAPVPEPARAAALPAFGRVAVRSTPPVRTLAASLGVDVSTVTGTGEGGLITRADVEAAAQGAVTAPGSGSAVATAVATAAAAATPAGGARRIPISGVRKLTAEAVTGSAFTAPHVTVFLSVDVTKSVRLIERLRTVPEFQARRIGILTLVAKAMTVAIGRNRSVNARWDAKAGEIIEFDYVNLGIAAATPRGLIVPNIPHADGMTLAGLADALAQLTATAREGKTPPGAMTGGTISITNVGVFGVDAGTPILNPGEAAILAMGAIRRQPWEHKGRIALREVMTLSLSFDHRVVDGEQGSRFLADVAGLLRDPGTVMAVV